GNGWRADDRQRGGFRGHDRKGQGPPWRGAAPEKVVGGILLAAAETHAQCRNAEQVGNNNGKVQRMDAHRVFFSAAPLDAAEKCVEDSGAREPASRRLCGMWAWAARVVSTFRFCALALHSALRLSSVLAYAFSMRYVLGFDGGGTKTDCVLMDETGAILTRSRSGS